ncbi:MAG: asparaginase [Planctomycetota bacterium]
MSHEALVTFTRSNLDESHHHGGFCVVSEGRVVRSRGDIGVPCFYRSAAKPIQALAVVESGAPDRYGFTDEELALAVGSHSGAPMHTAVARSMFEKIGESPELLRCGGHASIDPAVRDAYVREGYETGRIEDNCSGKHAGMIGAAKAMGADPVTYAEPDHPVQQANLSNVALLSGLDREGIHVGTDGCAVPSCAISLEAMARAMERFANPDGLPAGTGAAARRIADAVWSHPDMVAGGRRFDTHLLRVGQGRLISKMGAEGMQTIGVAGARLGIAIKIADGGRRAVEALASALLLDLGLLEPADLADFYPRQVKTREGTPVGDVKVRLQ